MASTASGRGRPAIIDKADLDLGNGTNAIHPSRRRRRHRPDRAPAVLVAGRAPALGHPQRWAHQGDLHLRRRRQPVTRRSRHPGGSAGRPTARPSARAPPLLPRRQPARSEPAKTAAPPEQPRLPRREAPDQEVRRRAVSVLTRAATTKRAHPSGGRASCISERMRVLPNWFSTVEHNFAQHLTPLAGQPDLHFLQIGAYAGHATEWLSVNILTGENCLITDVDTWTRLLRRERAHGPGLVRRSSTSTSCGSSRSSSGCTPSWASPMCSSPSRAPRRDFRLRLRRRRAPRRERAPGRRPR